MASNCHKPRPFQQVADERHVVSGLGAKGNAVVIGSARPARGAACSKMPYLANSGSRVLASFPWGRFGVVNRVVRCGAGLFSFGRAFLLRGRFND
jgi:hypothetical protein